MWDAHYSLKSTCEKRTRYIVRCFMPSKASFDTSFNVRSLGISDKTLLVPSHLPRVMGSPAGLDLSGR